MENYTIYCTEEQTKKALELGAPLEFIEEGKSVPKHYIYEPQKWGYYIIPTAEQMVGWLETQKNINRIVVNIDELSSDNPWGFDVFSDEDDESFLWGSRYKSRGEATLGAIDAVLTYLENPWLGD